MRLILTFAIAAAVTALVTPVIRYFALQLSIVDQRSKRKLHNRVVTRFGGLAVYAGFMFAMTFAFIMGLRLDPDNFVNYLMIIMSSSLILILGIYDDSKGANALVKFSVQILAAFILIQTGFVIRSISNPFGSAIDLGAFAIPFTVLWLVGITNAVNLIDGMDGLAVGIVCIVGVSFFCMFFIGGDVFSKFFAMALAGSCLGFLRYNYPPAKIFLGDTGSLFLGFSVGALSILTHRKGCSEISLFIPAVICLAVPILDTSFALFRRIFIKKVNPFQADKEHIHHILLAKNLKHKEVLFILWGATAVLSVIAIILYYYAYQKYSL